MTLILGRRRVVRRFRGFLVVRHALPFGGQTVRSVVVPGTFGSWRHGQRRRSGVGASGRLAAAGTGTVAAAWRSEVLRLTSGKKEALALNIYLLSKVALC